MKTEKWRSGRIRHWFACICEKNQVCVGSNWKTHHLILGNTLSRSATDLSFGRFIYIWIHLYFKMANCFSSTCIFVRSFLHALFRNAKNERDILKYVLTLYIVYFLPNDRYLKKNVSFVKALKKILFTYWIQQNSLKFQIFS